MPIHHRRHIRTPYARTTRRMIRRSGVMNCYKKTGKNWTFCVYYKGLN
ncbi:MAG: hypothetical protein ACTSO9_01120 [Candidatus Helarchaeota archaeon]